MKRPIAGGARGGLGRHRDAAPIWAARCTVPKLVGGRRPAGRRGLATAPSVSDAAALPSSWRRSCTRCSAYSLPVRARPARATVDVSGVSHWPPPVRRWPAPLGLSHYRARTGARAQFSTHSRAAAVAAVRGRARGGPRRSTSRAPPSALGRRWASTSGARSASTREERGAFGPLYELYQLQTAHAVASTACGVLFLVSGYEIDFAALAVARRGGRRRPRRPRRQSAATSASTASLAQIIFEI